MAGLFNDVVAFVARVDLLAALGREIGSSNKAQIQEGAVLSAAVSLAGLADAVKLPPGQAWIERELPAIDGSLNRAAELVANDGYDDYHRLGHDVITGLLGVDRQVMAAHIADASGLTTDGASEVLVVTAWVVVGHLADRYQHGESIEDLTNLLQLERHDLRQAGWDPWLDGTFADSREHHLDDEPTAAVTSSFGAAGAQAIGTPTSSPQDTRHLGSDPYSEVERLRPAERSKWPMVVGALLLLVVAAGAAALLLRSSEAGEQIANPDPASGSASTADDAASDGTDDGASDAAGDDDESSLSSTTTSTAVESDTTNTLDLTDAVDVPEVVEYSLGLSDPQNASDAGGTVDLSLNTVSGEVCYAFDITGVQTPYAAHIHIGPSAANGGITVDFGMVEQPDSGCLEVHPADVVAAASSPSARYIEAHDPSGAFSVRGQLQEANAVVPAPEAPVDLDGQAHAVIVDGGIVLRGTVADQQTMDAFVGSYADLDGTAIQVANEIGIEAGAEPPSDRVLIEDSVFFDFDSVEISDEADEVLVGIARVIAARPAWSVAALGHTDSSGSPFYNFSLSLRRAQVVQQALTDLGAPPLAVTTEAFGPLAPRADNETADGRAENRRIDFVVDTGS